MEKIKFILSQTWLYFVAGIAGIFGYIWYLVTKNDAMKSKIAILEQKESIKKFTERLKEKEKESDDAEKDYRDVIAKYNAEHNDDTSH